MNIASLVERNAQRLPDMPALIEGTTNLTYARMQQRVEAASGHMRAAGVRPGDLVLIAVRSGLLNTVLLFGAARLGAVSCIIDWRARGAEQQAIVAALLPRLAMVDRPGEADVEYLVVDAGWTRAPAAGTPDLYHVAASAPAFLLLSSGTTGRSKAVSVSHSAAGWRGMLRAVEMRMTPGHRVLMPIPLTATTTMHGLLGQMLTASTSYFFPSIYSPEELYEALLRHRIEQTTVVPTVARWLLGLPWHGDLLLPDIAALRVVGAAFHAHEKQAVMQRITPNLYEAYGSAGAGFITFATPDDLVRRPTSVGLPSVSVTLEIVDGENRVLPPGTIGRVRVHSPTMASGYAGDTGADDRDEIFADGWYYPGDLGRVDEQGYVYLEGRAASVIIRGGQNIYPEEVERVLLEHAAVVEAAVIGRSDDELGEVPEAVLITRSAVSETDLVAHCRARLQSYKLPVAFRFVNELPRNATGKVDRAALMRAAR